MGRTAIRRSGIAGRAAWRELFGEHPPPTPAEVETWLRELDAAHERIYRAIVDGDAEQVRRIVQECPDLSRDADVLFQRAIECDQREVLEALLEAGLPAAHVNESGITPLMHAVNAGRVGMARRRLAAGVDPDVLLEHYDRKIDRDLTGLCALYFALRGGDPSMIELLLSVTRPGVQALAQQAHRRWQ